jgi:hypothetical protein
MRRRSFSSRSNGPGQARGLSRGSGSLKICKPTPLHPANFAVSPLNAVFVGVRLRSYGIERYLVVRPQPRRVVALDLGSGQIGAPFGSFIVFAGVLAARCLRSCSGSVIAAAAAGTAASVCRGDTFGAGCHGYCCSTRHRHPRDKTCRRMRRPSPSRNRPKSSCWRSHWRCEMSNG